MHHSLTHNGLANNKRICLTSANRRTIDIESSVTTAERTLKVKFHYAILVADIRSWSQTCSELEMDYGLSSSSLAGS